VTQLLKKSLDRTFLPEKFIFTGLKATAGAATAVVVVTAPADETIFEMALDVTAVGMMLEEEEGTVVGSGEGIITDFSSSDTAAAAAAAFSRICFGSDAATVPVDASDGDDGLASSCLTSSGASFCTAVGDDDEGSLNNYLHLTNYKIN
jgi:hypothetical protein